MKKKVRVALFSVCGQLLVAETNIYTMNNKREILIVLICFILMIPDNLFGTGLKVEIEKPVIPVLVKKEINPVLKITLLRNDDKPYIVTGIRVDLSGTTQISDVESIAVYGTDEQGMIDDRRQLSKISSLKEKLCFNDKIEVDTDTISFWIAVKLKDAVDLDHRIQIKCDEIRTTSGNIKKPMESGNRLRIGVAVRQKGQDGVVSSRIPGLATSLDGTLLAIFDARYDSSRDLQGDMDIALHRSVDKGKTWEPMQVILDMGEWGGLPEKYNGVSDACILVDETTKDIYVAGLWMYGALDDDGKWIDGLTENSDYWIHQWRQKGSQPGLGLKETCQFLITKSTDDGLTWSFPDDITPKTKRPEWWLFAPAPGHGITLDDGTLVFPTQGRDENGLPFSNITYSRDHGKNWITSNPAYSDVTENNVVQLNDGTIMLNMRDNRNRGKKEPNGRRICVTSDLGENWIEHPTSRKALVEPTCMASLHKHKYTVNGEEKTILLFANPNDYKTRDKLTLKVSFDDGLTWPEEHWILFDEYRSSGYSSITSVDKDTIGILYESSQADMAYIQIKLSELLR